MHARLLRMYVQCITFVVVEDCVRATRPRRRHRWPLFACLPRDVHRAFYDADPDATRPWTRTWAHSASRREWRRSRTRPHIGPEMKTVCEIRDVNRDVIWDSYLRTVDIKCR